MAMFVGQTKQELTYSGVTENDAQLTFKAPC